MEPDIRVGPSEAAVQSRRVYSAWKVHTIHELRTCSRETESKYEAELNNGADLETVLRRDEDLHKDWLRQVGQHHNELIDWVTTIFERPAERCLI